ncbi:type IV toxin-antitoxin system AbiEi family antitoxin domain-containing protein [Kribbella sp. NPDC050820]|uniref:type IV toxin-antitoxin system AbiEi family antitoxin domain-containing protein n=1 Tax=Kribbella sp. NPDC050820 TaxID=3155408 RepID=UPI0034057AE3
MNGKLAVIAAARGGWFDRDDVLAAGYSDAEIRSRVAAGQWVRLTRGAYAEPSPEVKSLAPWDREVWRHVRTAKAVYRRLRGRAVVSHQSALLLHGIAVSELDLARVQLTRLRGCGRSGETVCQHAASPPVREWVEAGDVRTTTPARAVVEAVRAAAYPVGVSVVDLALRLRVVTTEQLTEALDLFAGRAGIRTATRAVEFGDGRAESVGESRLRVLLANLGFSAPVPQAEIRDPGGHLVARVDFLLDDWGVVVEFDGAVKYGDGSPAALIAEKVREDRLRDLGYEVVRVTYSDLARPTALQTRLSRAINRSRRSSVLGYVTTSAL